MFHTYIKYGDNINSESRRVISKRYYEKHKDRLKKESSERRKLDREKNPDKYKKINREKWNKNKNDVKYLEKKKESDKKYNEKNKEKISQQRKKYYNDNKNKIRDAENIRRCNRTNDDKQKVARYMQQYFSDNREKISEYKKKYYEKRKQFVYDYLSDKRCHMCGDNNIKHLVFHHLDPTEKEHQISNIKTGNFDKIIDEISKCIVLCANCHVKLHYIENPRKIRVKLAKRFEREYKTLVGCIKCGETFYPCLQYHHVSSEGKSDIVSNISNMKDIIIEIEKCEVLCANCHGELRK